MTATYEERRGARAALVCETDARRVLSIGRSVLGGGRGASFG
jgi:hypothetical protein